MTLATRELPVSRVASDSANRILKFVDDTKLIGKVSSQAEIDVLRKDLNRLFEWSVEWQMAFNIEKCKVMHIGRNNTNSQYSMGGKVLAEVEEEKDLGVIVSKDVKVSKQCAAAAKKGYQILGLISRTFICKKRRIMLQLYKSLVRPFLDYCIQAWRPHLHKDIDVLERVQRRATRMVEECRGLEYVRRLEALKLTTLETRRVRADLIETFKIVKGMEGVCESDFFVRSDQNMGGGVGRDIVTRGNSCKLYKKRFRLDMAKYNFGNRVVNEWNFLPNNLVQVNSVDAFKSGLDKFLRNTRGYI